MQYLLEHSVIKLMKVAMLIVFLLNSCAKLDSMIGFPRSHVENSIKTDFSPPRTSWMLSSVVHCAKCFLIISFASVKKGGVALEHNLTCSSVECAF